MFPVPTEWPMTFRSDITCWPLLAASKYRCWRRLPITLSPPLPRSWERFKRVDYGGGLEEWHDGDIHIAEISSSLVSVPHLSKNSARRLRRILQ